MSIRNASTELRNIFDSLSRRGLKNGVIKIDVEGYEPTVLKGIANALPNDMKAFIVFESWDDNFNINEILDAFQGRAKASKLSRTVPWKKHWPTLIKAASLVFSRKILTRLETAVAGSCRGDIVLKID